MKHAYTHFVLSISVDNFKLGSTDAYDSVIDQLVSSRERITEVIEEVKREQQQLQLQQAAINLINWQLIFN